MARGSAGAGFSIAVGEVSCTFPKPGSVVCRERALSMRCLLAFIRWRNWSAYRPHRNRVQIQDCLVGAAIGPEGKCVAAGFRKGELAEPVRPGPAGATLRRLFDRTGKRLVSNGHNVLASALAAVAGIYDADIKFAGPIDIELPTQPIAAAG